MKLNSTPSGAYCPYNQGEYAMSTLAPTPTFSLPMGEEEWIERFKPVPNLIKPGNGFDFNSGCCLLDFTDLQVMMKEDRFTDDHVWSIVTAEDEDSDDELFFISHGFHWVNTLGYILTENAPELPITEDILLD